MAWKIRLRGDNPKFIDIMEEGAADSSGATAVLANFEGANDDDVSEHIVIKRLDAVITKAGFKT